MSDDARFNTTPLLISALGIVPIILLVVLAVRAMRKRPSQGPLLATVILSGTFALELTANEWFFAIWPQFWLVEIALVAGLVSFLWLICGRRGIGPALALVALYAIGTVQHYVLEFRGTAILPSDLLALRTALSVSGGYDYTPSLSMLWGGLALVVGLICCTQLRRKPTTAPAGRYQPHPAHMAPSPAPKPHPYALDLVCAAGVAALTAALVVVPDYGRVFGAGLDYWWSRDWYSHQGFLPSFIYAAQDLAVSAPEGYSRESAQTQEQAYADAYRAASDKRRKASTQQFETNKPNIIVIQNETFCDLSVFDGLKNDYTGPAAWNKAKKQALLHGALGVSVFGGGTCNTEFEFLTGNSLGYLGLSKYPFTMYDLSGASSLARQLKSAGYLTVGMHPNVASNWNRDRAYVQLGFDTFEDIDDYEGAQTFHGHVSDWATYEHALSRIEESDGPVFVFDVTMQNHSGYDTGTVPEDMLPNYTLDGLSDKNTVELNEYLACIEESDRAFAQLLAELKELDEPCVVVMYGDHHPWFSEAINDLLFPNEDADAHAERIHQTDYMVWANYKVDGWTDTGTEQGSSADLLAAQMLDALGGPLTDYQMAQLGATGADDFSDVAYLNFGEDL